MKRIAFWFAAVALPLLMGAASVGIYHASNHASAAKASDSLGGGTCCRHHM
jgi:hypothetical protein